MQMLNLIIFCTFAFSDAYVLSFVDYMEELREIVKGDVGWPRTELTCYEKTLRRGSLVKPDSIEYYEKLTYAKNVNFPHTFVDWYRVDNCIKNGELKGVRRVLPVNNDEIDVEYNGKDSIKKKRYRLVNGAYVRVD
ncbi:uncharacterized protein LOC128983708 [Macrosteles quadrilineatus]|uniref:uncharacterized protein LOC128983708 n=1 Tax=Macrosteles quadrilineatus TaxID=74068 RepID=UPI0023E2AE7B|nr:uncharacterized protein LOC128983708 [Macrosteles quadrilineatus]